MGKAKEKQAKEEARKAEAREDFTRLLRHTKSLKLDSSWEDIKPDLETHSAYKEVRVPHGTLDQCICSASACVETGLLKDSCLVTIHI